MMTTFPFVLWPIESRAIFRMTGIPSNVSLGVGANCWPMARSLSFAASPDMANNAQEKLCNRVNYVKRPRAMQDVG